MVAQAREYSGLGDDAVGEIQGVEERIVANTSKLQRIDSLGQSLQQMSHNLVGSVRAFKVREV